MIVRLFTLSSLLLLTIACVATGDAYPGSIENLSHKGNAIQGYDPVAYFSEGGGTPLKGTSEITAERDGATYHFVSEANRELFVENADRYAPRYGGWCAWAMIEGELVDVDPESFLIEDGALFLFYDGWLADTRKMWLAKGGSAARMAADAEWAKRVRNTPEPVEDH